MAKFMPQAKEWTEILMELEVDVQNYERMYPKVVLKQAPGCRYHATPEEKKDDIVVSVSASLG